MAELRKVIKRNGIEVDFESDKISKAIERAMKEVRGVVYNKEFVKNATIKVLGILYKSKTEQYHVEYIQDVVENVLMEIDKQLAKRFILYREEHRRLREENSREFYLDKIESYIDDKDWRVRENSNTQHSYGAMNKFIVEMVSKDYWLQRVYPKYITNAYKDGDFHIHDLGGLTLYCCGYSLRSVIEKGVKGIKNIPVSAPAKHFDSILSQLANIITIFQNEIMGAVAFSSFDVLLAPFVKNDKLDYEKVYQSLQNFIFQINSNSRAGAEPAFSNITNDLIVPNDLKNKHPKIAGKEMPYTYSDCQKEIDMINKAFCNLMYKGDANGAGFAYPIPTYNIHKDFDWENSELDILWEMTGKFGYPYFSNYINTDMSPEDSRSMCCRLRLDLKELRRKGGGLFGADENTGSIGVVTLNLPRYGFKNATGNKQDLLDEISKNMELARESLKIKVDFIQKKIFDKGMLPAFKEYVGTLSNHFLTVGYIGLNEMCINFFGDEESGIKSKKGWDLSYEVLEFMNNKLSEWQEEDEDFLYNLEATPAESTCYKLALSDKEKYGKKIYTQGENKPYYTNSCHMPVKDLTTIKDLYENQHLLQEKHSGGTVIHNYISNSISGEKAKQIVRFVNENYRAPYTDICPLYSICEEHGHLSGYYEICPQCGKPTVAYQKITGYTRPVNNFNEGKQEEFKDRKQMNGGV